ncbi:MAG: hypothetical protein WC538_22090 [Thermoanaerobaculia bacterium]|jgi:hypothetical protein
MANWHTCSAISSLRSRVNAVAPGRDRSSDGTIGDAAHATTKSDHNPDSLGRVKAIDITDDELLFNGNAFAEILRHNKDPRIKYVIHDGRIFSSLIKPWQWRPYVGANAHARHVHVSVTDEGADDGSPWRLK